MCRGMHAWMLLKSYTRETVTAQEEDGRNVDFTQWDVRPAHRPLENHASLSGTTPDTWETLTSLSAGKPRLHARRQCQQGTHVHRVCRCMHML